MKITESKDPNPLYKGFLNNFDFNEIYEEGQNANKNSKNPKSIKSLNMKANNVIDIKNIKNINLNTNIHSNNLSPSKSNENNINEQYDSKYSFKMNKIKDDYIDFLQKEFEDNTKKSIKLDTNNKELLKKCDDLIKDNKILSTIVNDRTNQLNKIIQENLTVKNELDKALITNEKNEKKLEFYEEQFNLYKTSKFKYNRDK